MEEVPGEDDGTHCTRHTLPACRATSSPAAELERDELLALLDRALELKAAPRSSRALEGRAVALVFEKPSTRTRLSFEAGIVELGGHPMVLRPDELQLSRGESVRDTALVLSRHVAGDRRAHRPRRRRSRSSPRHAEVPVFNMLTAGHHPCQALADLHDAARGVRRARRGCKLAYVGDGNNVARSLALVGGLAGRRGARRLAARLRARAGHGRAS